MRVVGLNCVYFRDKVVEEVQVAPVITRRVQDFPVLPPGKLQRQITLLHLAIII